MSRSDTQIDWQAIAARTGWSDAESFVAREILPAIRDVPVEARGRNGRVKPPVELPMSIAFGGFSVIFMSTFFFLPDSFLGNAARFVLFPLLFIGIFAATFWLFRGRLMAYFERIEARYIARLAALKPVAARAGLNYVPAPGGAPSVLKWIAKQGWAPAIVGRVTEMLDENGGMDEAVSIAGRSGLLQSATTQLGDPEAFERYNAEKVANLHFEDGFEGEWGGLALRAFEWVEKGDDAPDTWHLIMVFDLPLNLSGVTQLRTRRTSWPGYLGKRVLQDIPLSHSGFAERFRLRSDDAVEAHMIFDPAVVERVAALAKGHGANGRKATIEKVRAVAFGNYLVLDVAGEDRFALVDLETGEWSETRIARTLINVVEMKELASAVAEAFYLVARQRRNAS